MLTLQKVGLPLLTSQPLLQALPFFSRFTVSRLPISREPLLDGHLGPVEMVLILEGVDIERFQVKSRRPCWDMLVFQNKEKGCTNAVLQEFNSVFMQITHPFVLLN